MAGLSVVDARAVAKAWLIELVAAGSLDDAAELPAADLAREGPGLAGAVLAALGDDAALRRLALGGNLAWLAARAAAVTGAGGPGAAVRAVECLRRATQSAILTTGRLDAVSTAELADRLAHVCAVVAEAAAGSFASDPAGRPRRAAAAGIGPLTGRDDCAPLPPARRERRAEPASWRTVVERRLERHADDDSPFALLAIEADGRERLLAAQVDGEVDRMLEALECALVAELRPADQLLRDEPGRYWVTAPDTGPDAGRLLADRLAGAASEAVAHHGVPLAVSIGVATCPEDGDDPGTLSEAADRAMFRVRAAGAPVP